MHNKNHQAIILSVMKKILLLLLLSVSLFAVEIRLRPPDKFYNENNTIKADFHTTKIPLHNKLFSYIKYGIIITFTYDIHLFRQRVLWDSTVTNIKIVKKLKYNIWNNTFYVETDYPEKKIKLFKNKNKVKNEIFYLNKINISQKEHLDKNSLYYFKTRLTIKITKLKSLLHVIYNLLSIFKYKSSYSSSPLYTTQALLQADVDAFKKP